VAGTGPELSALRRLTEQLGIAAAVDFPGRIDNERIGELYSRADLMLNPSTADNMPVSILEALACGVPVVSTRAGGVPDLVVDGDSALLVPVGDAEAMAEAALRALRDPALCERLKAAGLRLVAGFAWPRLRERWRAAYWQAQRLQSAGVPQ
jgi:glycosyltransferase involved in cell wall biosynthesis